MEAAVDLSPHLSADDKRRALSHGQRLRSGRETIVFRVREGEAPRCRREVVIKCQGPDRFLDAAMNDLEGKHPRVSLVPKRRAPWIWFDPDVSNRKGVSNRVVFTNAQKQARWRVAHPEKHQENQRAYRKRRKGAIGETDNDRAERRSLLPCPGRNSTTGDKAPTAA